MKIRVNLYIKSILFSAPVENKEVEKETEQDVLETIEIMDGEQRGEMEEEKKSKEIFFYKIIEGLDCTPMLGRLCKEKGKKFVFSIEIHNCKSDSENGYVLVTIVKDTVGTSAAFRL